MSDDARAPEDAMTELRAELTRAARRHRIAALTLGVIIALILWTAVTDRDWLMLASWTAITLNAALLLRRWPAVERALRATRGRTEAVPVELVGSAWEAGITARTPDGARWRWTAEPAGLFSHRVSRLGTSWLADDPAHGTPPVLVQPAGRHDPRPHVSISRRPAYREDHL